MSLTFAEFRNPHPLKGVFSLIDAGKLEAGL
jgi:hypothetical protein